jgi:hypothetical protein
MEKGRKRKKKENKTFLEKIAGMLGERESGHKGNKAKQRNDRECICAKRERE